MFSMVVTSPVSHLGVASVRARLKTAAPLNQFFMLSTPALLNFAAPSNMPSMDVTADKSHAGDVPGPSSLLNSAASLNMFFVFATFFVSQVLMSWSKILAPWNMPSMSVTAVVFHFLMVSLLPLLNFVAPWNMPSMVSTEVKTHILVPGVMSWSNFMAPWNMPSMSVTDFISHFGVAAGMGWLKATAPLNMFEVLVKAVVSQFLMVSLPPLLNALAPWNMAFMSFTATVSQTGDVPGVSSWLNVSAFRNISCMSVTNFVSQVFRGWSKAFAPLNIRTMS